MLYFSRVKAGMILCVCLIGILLSIPSFIPAERLPAWYPKNHVNLGLDLQGGSYLLLEIDRDALLNARLETLREQAATTLKKAGIVASTKVASGRVLIDVANSNAAAKAITKIVSEFGADAVGRPALQLTYHPGGLTLSYTDEGRAMLLSNAVDQSIAIVRRRIDETGTSEPIVAKQGASRIRVELPGVNDPGRLRTLLGSTAKMTFHLVAHDADGAGPDVRILPMVSDPTARVPVLKRVEIDGANLIDATPRLSQDTGGWIVDFTLDSLGARQFAKTSTEHVGEPFAIVLDGKVISAPVINEPIIGGRGQIRGGFNAQGARDLAVLLRAGALPTSIAVIEERSVGASLGADAVHVGLVSIMVGLSLVIGFVIALYGRFGIYAAAALIVNLALTIAGLAMINATLTLPGIAGLLLALGMAVDANVLVNERTREELAKGKSARASVEGGFRRAYTTVLDANLTTLFKMVVLFVLGAGAIRGFAITISLGILVSMFTALVFVRYLTARYLHRCRPKQLKMGTRFHFLPSKTKFAFMRARHSGLIFSAVISLASVALAISPGLKMGIDFTGGITVEARVPDQTSLATLRREASELGLGPVQVQSFGGPNDILFRVENQEGGPKAQAAAVGKIQHMLGDVARGAEVRKVDVVGASVGDDLLSGALWGLGIAALAMFVYIACRFEWPFALGAVLTMFLDLTKTNGFTRSPGSSST